MIRVLHVLSALNDGGVERMLYNYYSHMNQDEIKFDFILHSTTNGMLEEYFESTGSTIFHVTPKHVSLRKNYREIKEIIKNGNYDVVHCHQNEMSFIPLMIAKKYKVPKRLMHSHTYKINQSFLSKLKTSIFSSIGVKNATDYLACTKAAGDWLFNGRGFTVVKNAIDVHSFIFNDDLRRKYRMDLNIDNKIVLGNVGRLFPGKNQSYLLKILSKLIQINNKYLGLFIGDGPLKENLIAEAKELDIENNVLFLGTRDDVSAIVNAMDMFVFTSEFEGLGMVLIESQINGLPIITSDRVPKEATMSSNVYRLPIGDENINKWVDEINNHIEDKRQDNIQTIRNAGYDATCEIDKLFKIYTA